MSEKHPLTLYGFNYNLKQSPVCQEAEGNFLSYMATKLPNPKTYYFYDSVNNTVIKSEAIRKTVFGLETFLITEGDYLFSLAGSTESEKHRQSIENNWDVILPELNYDGIILREFDVQGQVDPVEIKRRVLKKVCRPTLNPEAIAYLRNTIEHNAFRLLQNLFAIQGF